MKYGLFGKFVAQEGKREELISILLEAAELLRNNKECIHYVVGKTDEPNDIWISELWENKKAHDTSLDPEDVREVIIKAKPLIAEMSFRTEFEAVGGKGF